MTNDGGTEQIGSLIRQLRRQRNITQTALGASHYSKSYISGIEKNIIRPSPKALEFFATQLGLPRDYFTAFLERPASRKQEPHPFAEQSIQDEGFLLLHLLRKHTDPNARVPDELPPLATALSPSKQGNYFLLEALITQEKQEHDAALHALERALPLVSAQLQPAVLDAMGQHYYLKRSYAIALHYHHRALTLLKQATSLEPERGLLFPVALHCGEDYRFLGAYSQACEMYDLARSYLHAEQEMKSATLLYLGWGYCTYALSCQAAAQVLAARELAPLPLEEMERLFQRAITLAIQSRDVCQLSGDQKGEATARLLLAVTLLDLSTWRMQLIRVVGEALPTSYLTLLEDAEEQCRQVLLSCQDMLKHADASAAPDDVTIYAALGYLVRTFIQHATLARLSRNDDTASRERALAALVCQRALDALGEPAFPQAMLEATLTIRAERPVDGAPVLPCLPDLAEEAPAFRSRLPGRVEVYWAAGEVSEELGRTATSSVDARDSYKCADRCFQTALTLAGSIVSSHEREPGYLVRLHQHYALLLQERSTSAPDVGEETSRTLAVLLTDGLAQVQNAIISAQVSL